MYKLFVDTHSDLITIAFIKDNNVISEEVKSENGHAEVLVPTFKKLLEENNINIDDIKEIIAVNGPGSFTGIRIGLSLVKTLSYTKNIPVKLISSLECFLVSSNIDENKVAYLEDARGAYVYAFDKDNNPLMEEIYIEDYENIINKYKCVENKLDILKIVDYAKKLKEVNVHLIKPNYVKKIEVEK